MKKRTKTFLCAVTALLFVSGIGNGYAQTLQTLWSKASPANYSWNASDASRDAAVYGGKMYVIQNASPTSYVNVIDGATGNPIPGEQISLTGNTGFTIAVDDVGNLIIPTNTGGAAIATVRKVNIATGVVSNLSTAFGGSARTDFIAVRGNTSSATVPAYILAAATQTVNTIFSWEILNGARTETPIRTYDRGYTGTAAGIDWIDNTHFLQTQTNRWPAIMTVGDLASDNFVTGTPQEIKISAGTGDVLANSTGGTSGGAVFTLGGVQYLVVPFQTANDGSARSGSVAIFDITNPSSPTRIEVTPRIGSANNAPSHLSINVIKNSDNEVVIYVFAPNNGAAAYKFTTGAVEPPKTVNFSIKDGVGGTLAVNQGSYNNTTGSGSFDSNNGTVTFKAEPQAGRRVKWFINGELLTFKGEGTVPVTAWDGSEVFWNKCVTIDGKSMDGGDSIAVLTVYKNKKYDETLTLTKEKMQHVKIPGGITSVVAEFERDVACEAEITCSSADRVDPRINNGHIGSLVVERSAWFPVAGDIAQPWTKFEFAGAGKYIDKIEYRRRPNAQNRATKFTVTFDAASGVAPINVDLDVAEADNYYKVITIPGGPKLIKSAEFKITEWKASSGTAGTQPGFSRIKLIEGDGEVVINKPVTFSIKGGIGGRLAVKQGSYNNTSGSGVFDSDNGTATFEAIPDAGRRVKWFINGECLTYKKEDVVPVTAWGGSNVNWNTLVTVDNKAMNGGDSIAILTVYKNKKYDETLTLTKERMQDTRVDGTGITNVEVEFERDIACDATLTCSSADYVDPRINNGHIGSLVVERSAWFPKTLANVEEPWVKFEFSEAKYIERIDFRRRPRGNDQVTKFTITFDAASGVSPITVSLNVGNSDAYPDNYYKSQAMPGGGAKIKSAEFKITEYKKNSPEGTAIAPDGHQPGFSRIKLIEGIDPTGVKDSFVSGLDVYPVPFADELQIAGAANNILRVTNIAGVTVHTQLIGSANETLNLGKLAAGMYFFSFEKDGQVKTVKAVKK